MLKTKNNDFTILRPNVKKWIVITMISILGIKLGFILGDEFRGYRKAISGNYADNIIHLSEIKKDRAIFFALLREELIQHLKDGTSVDLTVSKFQREFTKPSLQHEITNRHEILILSTSALLATKNYAVNHSIKEEQLKSIQSLFKDYVSLKVEFSSGVLKRNGMLFVPNKIEVEDFLSPVYTLSLMNIERENNKSSLREFNYKR